MAIRLPLWCELADSWVTKHFFSCVSFLLKLLMQCISDLGQSARGIFQAVHVSMLSIHQRTRHTDILNYARRSPYPGHKATWQCSEPVYQQWSLHITIQWNRSTFCSFQPLDLCRIVTAYFTINPRCSLNIVSQITMLIILSMLGWVTRAAGWLTVNGKTTGGMLVSASYTLRSDQRTP